MKPFRVLTLDGGGMRGLYTATLLRALAQRFDEKFTREEPDIGKAFDLICGTSTGAILACGLASGISAQTIRDLYIKEGDAIFPSPMPGEMDVYKLGGFEVQKLWKWGFEHRTKPSANAARLEKALDTFGKITLKELYDKRRIALCVPTIDVSNYRAWVFKTPHTPGKHRDNGYTLTQVCLASAAAPIFFPLASQIDPNDEHNRQYFADGGLWANNPIVVGLVEALSLAQKGQPIEIVSVGACDKPSGDPKSLSSTNWGLLDWRVGARIVEMSLAAQSFGYTNIAKFLCTSLNNIGFNIRIARLEETNKSPEQYSAIGLDRADQIARDTLIQIATQDASSIHSEALKKTKPDLDIVQSIFSSLESIASGGN